VGVRWAWNRQTAKGPGTGEIATGPREGTEELPDVRRLARHGAVSMGGLITGAALQFGMVLAVTHGLTTAEAGALLTAVALFMILSNCGDLGADDALLRTMAAMRSRGDLTATRQYLKAALGPVVVVGSISGIALFVFASDAARVIFSPDQRETGITYLQVFAPFLAVASLGNVSLSAVRGLGAIRTYVNVQNIIVPFLRFLCVVAAIALGLGTHYIGLAWAVPLTVGVIISMRALLRMTIDSQNTVASNRWFVVRDVWSFAAPRALASAFGVTITYVDVLIVGALGSTKTAAIYAAISRLYVVANYGLLGLRTAVGPQFSELITLRRIDRLQTVYGVSTAWAGLLCWPVYTVFLVYAPVAARVFGHDYAEGSTALAILAVGGLVNVGTGGVVLLLLMSGHSTLNLINTAVALVLNVAFNLILVPRYSLNGAALAWAASIIATNVATVLEVRLLIGVKPFGRGYVGVAAACAFTFGLIGAILRIALGATWVSLVASIMISVPLYVAALWFARGNLELGAARDAIGRPRRAEQAV
jgi:O-antigen/teichoic acid export membrane protein